MDDQYPHPPEGPSSSNRLDAKVAIPRIQGHDYQMPTTARTPRVRTDVVSTACTQCRKRKIKCSGDRPSCFNCTKQDHDCHYDQGRKDRLQGAIRKNQLLIQLLINISGQLDDETKKRVEDTLASFEDDTPPPPLSRPPVSQNKRPRQVSSPQYNDDAMSPTSADGGEAHVSASVGSNGDLDFIQKDLLQNNDADSAVGYLGRNSQVQWLRALKIKVEQPEDEPSGISYGPPGDTGEAFNKRAEALHARQEKSESRGVHQRSFTSYYFYLDRTNIEIDIDDPHIIPSAQTAERLFEYYKKAVHSPFKILDDIFEAQLQMFFSEQHGFTFHVSSKWKAIMNLIFAIGARYSYLVDAGWRADDRDHLVYMWRAVHLLQLDTMNTLVSHPDQSLIQATGLLSFYYLTIGHVSRAWYMIGIAIRHAQAAGLHLRFKDPAISPKRKKTLAQIWWALYSIESILTSITGRPRTIAAEDCTVPLPGVVGSDMQTSHGNTTPNLSTTLSLSRGSGSSINEQGTNVSVHSFDVAYIRLDILMDKILSGLYSTRKSSKSWKVAQGEIASLSKELEAWAIQSLANGPSSATSKHNLSREKLLLYFYYHSAKICITRPCLCRLDLRIKGQSKESSHFDQKMAEACISAALDITSILPDPPNPKWLYENGPWWAAVHIIMQSLTVLLELSLGAIHLAVNKSHVTSCVDKLIRWLQSMKLVDAVSGSAYNVVAKILSKQSEEEAAAKEMPKPQPTTDGQQQYSPHNVTPASQQKHYVQPLISESLNSMWPSSDAFSSGAFSNGAFLPQSNTGNFYPDDISGASYFNDSNAGLYEF
ncbi:fungal specific transcription factor domain containing protein, partial [Pyrenophora tritici-repentis]